MGQRSSPFYVAAADDFDEIGRVRLDDASRVEVEKHGQAYP